jgi:DNA-binding response OmpR family regulator
MNDRILIVDDDKESSFIIKNKLAKFGYQCDIEGSAEGALTYLKNDRPSLILLDVMLPNKSGIDFLTEVRASFSKIELPIIMITLNSSDDDIVEALELGANDYITKPLHFQIAKARIDTQLTLNALHVKSVDLKEVETLNIIITTYNHEINNPLMVIIGNIRDDISQMSDDNLRRIRVSANIITEIVKSIREVTSSSIETVEYNEHIKMLKLKKVKKT